MHTNSGVNNKAAFLMTDGGTFNGRTVTGIGITKASRIYYEVQTAMLTSGSDYADLASALPQACTNLSGTAGGDHGGELLRGRQGGRGGRDEHRPARRARAAGARRGVPERPGPAPTSCARASSRLPNRGTGAARGGWGYEGPPTRTAARTASTGNDPGLIGDTSPG